MKRLFGALVTVALWSALFASLGGVRAAADPALTVSDASGTVGSEIYLDVIINNNPGFDVLQCEIDYDPSLLNLKNVEGCIEGDGQFYLPDGSSTAFIYFGLILSENGALLGKYPSVSAPEASIARLTFELLAEGDAEVKVRAVEAMSFDSEYEVRSFPVESGSARVAVLPVPTILYGDSDGNGRVNGRDVLHLLSYLANYDYETALSSVSIADGADANGDGKVNGRDVLILRNYIANESYGTGTPAAESFDISLSDASATEGYAEVTIKVSENPGVALFLATLRYDTDALILEGVQNGSVLADLTSGVNLVWSDDSDSRLTGTLATLRFRIKDGASGKYTIELIGRECYSMTADVPWRISVGSVTVNAPHSHSAASDKWESDGSSHWHTCACGEIVDKSAHSGGTATCTAKPECSVCAAEYGAKDPTCHSRSQNKIADERLRVPGTGLDCQSYKEYYYECKECRAATGEIWRDTATGEHKLGALVASIKEIHTENELRAGVSAYYNCVFCGAFFTENKEPTAWESLLGNLPEHSYGGYIFDESGHRKICICGKAAFAGAHIYDGEGDMICNVCSYTRSCKHADVAHVPFLAASCTLVGNIEYWYCRNCGELFDRADISSASKPISTLIPARGHSFLEKREDVAHLRSEAKNCTERSSYWYSCTACGAISDKDFFEGSGAGAHVDTVLPAVLPSCTQNGITERVFCSLCGFVAKESILIPAKGHIFGTWVTVTVPTESQVGKTARFCVNCRFEESRIIPALPVTTKAEETTEPPAETTVFADQTTAIPAQTTVFVEETTASPEETEAPPEETTVFAEETAELTEEMTRTPEETAVFEEESSFAAEIPSTGDDSVFFIGLLFATLAALPLIAALGKKEDK